MLDGVFWPLEGGGDVWCRRLEGCRRVGGCVGCWRVCMGIGCGEGWRGVGCWCLWGIGGWMLCVVYEAGGRLGIGG